MLTADLCEHVSHMASCTSLPGPLCYLILQTVAHMLCLTWAYIKYDTGSIVTLNSVCCVGNSAGRWADSELG